MTLSRVDMPVSLVEGLKILERDQYYCQYCGLDGRASFDNALVMSMSVLWAITSQGNRRSQSS